MHQACEVLRSRRIGDIYRDERQEAALGDLLSQLCSRQHNINLMGRLKAGRKAENGDTVLGQRSCRKGGDVWQMDT